MAGRKLQRQREEAVAALTDEQAADLARSLIPRFSITQVQSLLSGARTSGTAVAAAGGPRPALAALVARDSHTARIAIAMRWHTAEVEQALGITRTERQQRP